MREEGQHVSIAQLCRWFGVPRSTFYYRPAVGQGPRPPVVDTVVDRVLDHLGVENATQRWKETL